MLCFPRERDTIDIAFFVDNAQPMCFKQKLLLIGLMWLFYSKHVNCQKSVVDLAKYLQNVLSIQHAMDKSCACPFMDIWPYSNRTIKMYQFTRIRPFFTENRIPGVPNKYSWISSVPSQVENVDNPVIDIQMSIIRISRIFLYTAG